MKSSSSSIMIKSSMLKYKKDLIVVAHHDDDGRHGDIELESCPLLGRRTNTTTSTTLPVNGKGTLHRCITGSWWIFPLTDLSWTYVVKKEEDDSSSEKSCCVKDVEEDHYHDRHDDDDPPHHNHDPIFSPKQKGISIALFIMTVIWLLKEPSTRPSSFPTICPDPLVIQSPFVASNLFDQAKMEGFYYQIAMKDVTQPRMCSCQTSNKTVVSGTKLHDDFSIQCANKVYHSDLSFEYSDDVPGVAIGTWGGVPGLDRIRFPNTVVDVGLNEETGEYDWLIEFQCIQGESKKGRNLIAFYAFNFYSKEYKNQGPRVKAMEQIFRARGLGIFLDSGRDLAIIDHSDCIENHF